MAKKSKDQTSKKKKTTEGFQKTGKALNRDDLFDKDLSLKSPPGDSSDKKK